MRWKIKYDEELNYKTPNKVEQLGLFLDSTVR